MSSLSLAKRAVAPLAAAIRKLCGPQIGAGRKHTAANLLKGVDPDLAAYCTVRVDRHRDRVETALQSHTPRSAQEVILGIGRVQGTRSAGARSTSEKTLMSGGGAGISSPGPMGPLSCS
jgi:hypothetical protein